MSQRFFWLTRANALTLLRLLLAPVLALAILEGTESVAAMFFWMAVVTDVADGRTARRFGEETRYGRFFDHAADAIFVTAGTAALAGVGALPAALPVLIAVAFAQYAVDFRFVDANNLRKSRLGHLNGIAYYVIVALPVMRDAIGISWPGAELVWAGGWLLVASTIASVATRFRFAWSAK
jgi:phosphatidylglycerophosphate synthase